jgi:hypothetical protein
MTTLIYQRSIIVVKETLLNHTFGWGIDGMDNAIVIYLKIIRIVIVDHVLL